MSDQRPQNTPSIKTPPVPTKAATAPMEQLGLAEPSGSSGMSKIKAFGSEKASHSGPAVQFKRTPTTPGTGAMRVKSFLGKISGPGMEYMDNTINVWLDAHPEVEVKFVTTVVGPTDGKANDTSIVMNLWY